MIQGQEETQEKARKSKGGSILHDQSEKNRGDDEEDDTVQVPSGSHYQVAAHCRNTLGTVQTLSMTVCLPLNLCEYFQNTIHLS